MRAPVVVLVAFAIAASGTCARRGGAHQWPSRPVTVIVPFGPGTGSDLVARLLAPRLSERWRQPVVVDNRPGADGIVGVQAFASSKDGHTLVFTPAGPITLSPLLHERLPFDPVRDLVPTAAVVTASIGIAATTTIKSSSLADVAALARHQPGRLLWAATPGLPEVIFKAFLALEKLEMKHVPYREPSMAVQDLAAGRIHAGVFAVPTVMTQVRAGSVRLLAVTTTARIAAAPDVPTLAEVGYPPLSSDGRWGFYGWREISAALRDRISDDVRHVLHDREIASRLEAMGLTVAPGGADEFARALEQQRGQVHDIARIIGLKPPSSRGAQ